MIKAIAVGLMLVAAPVMAHEGVSMTAKSDVKEHAPMKKKGKMKKVAKAKAVKEHWVCPMHDGGESDHAGKCPKCGMDLVKEEAATKEEKK